MRQELATIKSVVNRLADALLSGPNPPQPVAVAVPPRPVPAPRRPVPTPGPVPAPRRHVPTPGPVPAPRRPVPAPAPRPVPAPRRHVGPASPPHLLVTAASILNDIPPDVVSDSSSNISSPGQATPQVQQATLRPMRLFHSVGSPPSPSPRVRPQPSQRTYSKAKPKAPVRTAEQGPSEPVLELSRNTLLNIRHTASSAKNFAVHCMRRMFTVESRLQPDLNWNGKKGKGPLSPEGRRKGAIKLYVQEHYNVTDTRKMYAQMASAIDKCNRNLRIEHNKN